MSESDFPVLLYRAVDVTEGALLVSALETEGIQTSSTEAQGAIGFGELSSESLQVQIFVAPQDAERGKKVIEEFQARYRQGGASGPAWSCSQCGEQNDANFQVCWKCNQEKA